jgi:hypothetical protein
MNDIELAESDRIKSNQIESNRIESDLVDSIRFDSIRFDSIRFDSNLTFRFDSIHIRVLCELCIIGSMFDTTILKRFFSYLSYCVVPSLSTSNIPSDVPSDVPSYGKFSFDLFCCTNETMND